MILKRLKLNNFLIHENTEIEFAPDGITVFIGENGAGKSSIIEGIVYGIFGKTDRGKIEELIKWGRKQAIVEIEFKKGNSEYKVERTITRSGKKAVSTGVVFKKEKGRYIPYYQKNISREIPKITGINYKTFLSSVLVKQGDIEGLIDLSPKERAKVFEDILDMTLYQLLAENISQIRRELQNQLNWMENDTRQISELEKEYLEVKKQIHSLQEEKNQIQRQLNEKQQAQKKVKKDIEFLIEEKEKNLKNKAKIEKFKEILKITENQISEKKARLEQIQIEEKKLPVLEEKVNKLKELEQIFEKAQKIEVLKERLNNIKQKIEEFKKKEEEYLNLKEIAREYEEKEKEIKKLQEEITSLEKVLSEKKTLEEQLKNIKEKSENILTKLSKILDKLLSYKKSYLILKDNPLTINQFIQNNQEKIKHLTSEKEKLSEEKGKIKAYGEELNKKLQNLSSIEGTCPTCNRPLDQHTKKELIQDIEKELEKKREEYKKLNAKEKSIQEELSVEKSVEPLLQKFKEYFDKYSEYQKEITNLKSKITVLSGRTKEIKQLQEKLKMFDDFIKENKDLYHRYVEANRFIKSVDFKELSRIEKSLLTEIKSLQEGLPEEINLPEIKQQIKELKEFEKEHTRIISLVKDKTKLKEEIAELENKKEEIIKNIKSTQRLLIDETKLDKNLNTKKEELSKIEDTISSLNLELNKIDKEIGKFSGIEASIKKDIEKIKEQLVKAQEINKKIEKYRIIENALGPKGIQKIIRDHALYELPRITNIIFSSFGFPFQQVRFSEEFDISLSVPTFEREDRFVPVSSISGGQRVALGLALRLAIGRFLSNKADFLILDEPTIHLDQQRRSDLIDILIGLKEKKFVKQLIVVTHDTEVEDAADSIYYVEQGRVKAID